MKKALNLWMKMLNLWQKLDREFLIAISLRRPSLNLINPFEWNFICLTSKSNKNNAFD